MVDPTTTNRSFAVPTHGSDVDTWDVPLNNNFGLLDTILGGVTTIALTNANVTLNAAQLQCGTIRFTGTLSANVTIGWPAVSGWWLIDNRTTGAFYVSLSCGGSEVISTPQGQATWIFIDGTAVRFGNLQPIGTYLDYAGTVAPLWVASCTIPPFLICDGTTFNAGTYPILNAILGGNTLPDFRGRIRASLNGGTGRITTAGSGIDGDTRRSAGGAQSLTIGQVNLPAVAPSFSGALITIGAIALNSPVPSPSGSTVAPTPSGVFGTGGPFTPTVTIPPFTPAGTISALGSGTALASMPPTCIGGVTLIRAG